MNISCILPPNNDKLNIRGFTQNGPLISTLLRKSLWPEAQGCFFGCHYGFSFSTRRIYDVLNSFLVHSVSCWVLKKKSMQLLVGACWEVTPLGTNISPKKPLLSRWVSFSPGGIWTCSLEVTWLKLHRLDVRRLSKLQRRRKNRNFQPRGLNMLLSMFLFGMSRKDTGNASPKYESIEFRFRGSSFQGWDNMTWNCTLKKRT